jgi:CheY-like chemotaxis protein
MSSTTGQSLRVFYLEDNPLIICHVEQLLEQFGCVFAGAVASFEELRQMAGKTKIDAALVDIDLADGRTGPQAAAWLAERGIPSVFVTGQEHLAAEYDDVSVGLLPKPVTEQGIARAVDMLRKAREYR